ncbi:hypothetical protein VPH35_006187 [Triticum aestivum]
MWRGGASAADVLRHYGRCYWELFKARLGCTAAQWRILEENQGQTQSQSAVVCVTSGAATTPTSPPVHAAMWATSVGAAGTTLLACKANFLPAGLAASNLIMYAFVYTSLKQIHHVNTWVGAVVEAIPPLLGWAAAASEVSLNSTFLPAALYFWQLPHFMALAYLCRDDYVAGGGKRTAWVSLRNCLYMLPLGLLAYNWGLTSGWFSFEASFLMTGLTIGALSFVLDPTHKSARRMFHGSLLYLPALMAGLILHRLPNQ